MKHATTSHHTGERRWERRMLHKLNRIVSGFPWVQHINSPAADFPALLQRMQHPTGAIESALGGIKIMITWCCYGNNTYIGNYFILFSLV